MIKTLTTVRCDRCGKKIYTKQGDHEEVRRTFRMFGWRFPFENDTTCYCAKCVKEMEESK